MAIRTLIVGNDGANNLAGTSGDELIYGFNPDGPQGQVSSIAATRVASGLTQPVFASAPPGDYDRLFIVEKTGQIKILDLTTGQVQSTPFLDVSNQISTGSESGLLGLAFDPDFVHNGLFYVDLINTSGDTEVRRYHVSATDPNQADAASSSLIIAVDQPDGLGNHKAGWLGFGPDGDLYVALGDGGGAGDPLGSGQNIDTLLGKILRLNVNGDDFPADPTRNYAIPADNPFVSKPGADEIYAFGLRNPWRPGFDDGLGTLYIADVGQNTWEEIDIGQAGANYGWNVFEGPATFAGGTPTGGSAVPPIYSYNHSVGQSITGGYVYRGSSDGLQGQYFFADFVASKIFTLRFDGSQWVATERTGQIVPDFGAVNSPSSFGEDGAGNLYVVDFGGEVFRLTPQVVSADQGDAISGMGGNDVMFGGAGNDSLSDGGGFGAGSDKLYGGDGNDVLSVTSSGTNLLDGGPGGDQLSAVGAGSDSLYGGDGNDVLLADGTGAKTLLGRNGDDIVYAQGMGGESIAGGAGNDIVLASGNGNYSIDGGAGSDSLYATGNGNDVLFGGAADAGNDVLYASGTGADSLMGGDGSDTLIGAGSGAYTLDAGNGDDLIYAQGMGAETAYGGAGNDIILASGSGNDSIDGGAGNDNIYALGDGANALSGGAGNDLVYAAGGGANSLAGGDDDDTVIGAGSGAYMLDAGNGNDLIYAQGIGGETAQGGAGNDVMLGSGNGNYALDGGAGNDNIYATGNGNDTLTGGTTDAGNDFIYASGTGADSLSGGDGNDTVIGAGDGAYTLDGGNGNDLIYAQGAGAEAVLGGADNDVVVASGTGAYSIDGGLGNDSIYASGSGNDTLLGNDGNDFISTGTGLESINGGNGNDTLFFSANSAQNDTLDGGAGTNDRVIFQGKATSNIVSEQTTAGITKLVFDAASGGQTVFVQNVETLQFTDGMQTPPYPTLP